MNVLVTGGAGYIGSVVTRVLMEAGHEVTVIDNLDHGHKGSVPKGVLLLNADISCLHEEINFEYQIDAVVHLAALISVQESMEKPEKYWRNNVIETLHFLSALREHGVKKLVFASTAAVYGDPMRIPILEDDPKTPTSTYGQTKLAMDMAIESECKGHGMGATSLRFFNVAGAYKDAGEMHPVESHLIPLALSAAEDELPIRLFGTDYPTKDGTCIRDYIHVADLADAIVLALEQLEPGKHSIYNLGNGNGYSNREVLDTVEQVTGKKLTIIEEGRRAGDPAVLVASSEKAKRELGWTPQRTDLEDIIFSANSFKSLGQTIPNLF